MKVLIYTKETAPRYKNVMYYGDWSIGDEEGNFYPEQIPADQITHLNFAFLDFDSQGELKFCNDDRLLQFPQILEQIDEMPMGIRLLQSLNKIRRENANLRLGISVGGWAKSGDFTPVASDAKIRSRFIENIIMFLKYMELDYVDLDWEFPGEKRFGDAIDDINDEGTPYGAIEDREYFTLLLKELRQALDSCEVKEGKYYELTVTLPAGAARLEGCIDVKSVFETVDFVSMMTYDFHGPWENRAMHQSALYKNAKDPMGAAGFAVDTCVDYLLSKGVAAEKIIVGVAFYTRGWEKVQDNGGVSGLPGLFGKAQMVNQDVDKSDTFGADNFLPVRKGYGGRKGGVWAYRTIEALKERYPGLVYYFDEEAKAPYYYSENGAFFTFDDSASIEAKALYVKEKGLGGLIGWMQSQDAQSNKESKVRDALTRSMKEGLYGSAELNKYKE